MTAGSSVSILSRNMWWEFWCANGNEAESTQTSNGMYTAQGINNFSGPRDVIGPSSR